MNRSPSNRPIRKILAVIATGGGSTVLIWILGTFFAIEMPPDVAAMIIFIITSAAGYLMPPSAQDGLVFEPEIVREPEPEAEEEDEASE